VTKTWLLSLCAVLLAEFGYAKCPALTLEDLSQLREKHPSIRLKFFSSWCGSCREDLTAPPKDAIPTFFVGTMDTQSRVIQAMEYARGNHDRCYWDQDNNIADYFNVKSVPFEVVLTASK